MTYTIKEAAEQSGLSVYTLRFYDKAGLLPFVARNPAGYRVFTDGDLNLLHTIQCLKNTGMKINDIRTYITLVMQGVGSVDSRRGRHIDKRWSSNKPALLKVCRKLITSCKCMPPLMLRRRSKLN